VACGLRVGSTSRTWQRGRCLLFDDAFDHEAWNYGSRDRTVLIVDVWHPDLSEDEVILLEALHGQVVRQAQQLSRYWGSNQRARKRSEAARAAGSEDALRSPLT
jgi:aspartyl/asparaginyl beta-hydroxylase (cupin superfamily)